MDLALAEYAPGARVVVNQQVYTSQGMTLNCYDPEQGPFERFFFIVCRRCGHFQTGRDVPQRCDACAHETNWQGWAAQGATAPVIPGDELGETAMQAALVVAASAAVGETLEDAVTPPPSIVRSYIKPRAFSVAYSRRPVATAYHETRPYTASSRCVSINTAEESLVRLGGGQTAVSFKFVPDQEILYFNAGMSPRRAGNTAIHGYGYRVCLACGYAEPEEGYGKPPSPEMLDHDKLTEGDQCTGPRRAWANVILGAEARTDVLIFRLPTAVLDGDWATSPDVLVTTFMTALRMAAARLLEVDNRFIGGQVQRVRLESGNLEAIDILLFDAGAGDTGYMSRLRDQPLDVIEEAIGYLDCPDAAEDDGGGLCTTCCHRCLLSYDSAWYAQRGLLDRRATRAWVDARRADMLGTGQIIDGQPVGRAFDVVHSLRFGSGIVRLFLPFFTGEGLESSEHLLRRLFEVTIRRAGCRVSVLLPRTSIDNMGQESGYRARSQLWQWQQNSPQFQIRTVVQDAISGYSHFRLAVNGREFFLDDFDATVDFAAPGSRQVSWFAAKEGDGGCQAFDTLWGKAEAVPQPKLPETTVRLDIPNGTDATAPNSLYQKLASHPQIQLGNLLAGRQVVRLTYQDRYLRSPHAWRNLISLMRQLPMSPNCDILALTVQQDSSGEERWRPDVGNASDVGRIVVHVHADFAEREMGYVMDYLAAQCGLQRDRCRLGMLSREVRGRYTYSVQQGRQIWTPGWLGDEHARKMLCILDDGSGFSLMFDQGMDWACPRESYRFDTVRPGPGSPLNPSLFDGARPYLTRLSYAVFRRELTPSEKGLWDLCGALTSNQCRWC